MVFSKSAFCATEIEMGKDAEMAGKYREALAHYITAYQSSPEGSAEHKEAMARYITALKYMAEATHEDRGLRESIARIVQKFNPPPVVSDESVILEGRAEAEAAARAVQAPDEMMSVTSEYKKALKRAPWNASYHYNEGLVFEKAGAYKEAIQSFRLYLLSMPDAEDAREAKKKIGRLEFMMEKAAASPVAVFDPSSLTGDWTVEYADSMQTDIASARAYTGPWLGMPSERVQISSSGRIVQITRWAGESRFEYEGTVKGHNLSGTVTVIRPPLPPGWIQLGYRDTCELTKFPFEGTLSEKADTLVLIQIGSATEKVDEEARLNTCEPYELNFIYRLSRKSQ